MVVVFDKSRQLIDRQLENLTKFFGKYHIEHDHDSGKKISQN